MCHAGKTASPFLASTSPSPARTAHTLTHPLSPLANAKLDLFFPGVISKALEMRPLEEMTLSLLENRV